MAVAEYATPKYVESSVSVWDRIVESKEEAHLVLPFVRNKYKLVDNGAGLRGVVADDGVADHAEGRVAAEGNVTFPAAFTLPEYRSRRSRSNGGPGCTRTLDDVN